jgi:succinate dehydrogenase/fumarate reductase cytochrome b subunit
MAERRVLTRGFGTPESWRDTKAGMWAWLIQRLAAVALLGVIAFHLANPFRREVQAALLGLVLLHGLLGVRARTHGDPTWYPSGPRSANRGIGAAFGLVVGILTAGKRKVVVPPPARSTA